MTRRMASALECHDPYIRGDLHTITLADSPQWTTVEHETVQKCQELCDQVIGVISQRTKESACVAFEHCNDVLEKMGELSRYLQLIEERGHMIQTAQERQREGAKLSTHQQERASEAPECVRSRKQSHTIQTNSRPVATNLFKNIHVGEDSVHVIKATTGDVITAKNISVGARSMLCLGNLSEVLRAATSEEDLATPERLRGHMNATRQGVAICAKAQEHLREEVATIDNCATGDAIQLMVSTNDKPIHGQNRGMGLRTRQLGGYVDRDLVRDAIRSFSGTATPEARHDGA